MLRRREFIKGIIGVAAGLTCLPVKAEPKSFIPKPEYPLGTRKELPDGRVFRYCRAARNVKKGDFVNYVNKEKMVAISGISYGNKWVQTYGPCMVNTKGLIHLT